LSARCLFGISLCITGVLRIYYIWKVYYDTYDVTWAAQDAWVWTSVEAHLAIICASAPALKVFLRQYFQTSGVTGSFGNSWSRSRRRLSSYARRKAGRSTNHSDDAKTGLSTEATAKGSHNGSKMDASRKGTLTDIELGGINVTHDVEVASTYDDRPWTRSSHFKSPQPVQPHSQLHGSDEKSRAAYHAMTTSETPWLNDASSASGESTSPQSHRTSTNSR